MSAENESHAQDREDRERIFEDQARRRLRALFPTPTGLSFDEVVRGAVDLIHQSGCYCRAAKIPRPKRKVPTNQKEPSADDWIAEHVEGWENCRIIGTIAIGRAWKGIERQGARTQGTSKVTVERHETIVRYHKRDWGVYRIAKELGMSPKTVRGRLSLVYASKAAA